MVTTPITTSNAVPRLLYTVTSFVVSEQNRMGKQLTDKAIQQFHERGYYLPLDVASVEEIQEMRLQLEAFEAKSGSVLRGTNRFKNHLLFKWLSDLIRSPKILDAVEDLIGCPHRQSSVTLIIICQSIDHTSSVRALPGGRALRPCEGCSGGRRKVIWGCEEGCGICSALGEVGGFR